MSLATLAQQWKALPEADKLVYVGNAAERVADHPDGGVARSIVPPSEGELQEKIRSHTPLGCGSFEYCVSEEALDDFTDDVKKHAAAWKRKFSSFIGPGSADIHNCSVSQCCKSYGAGVCENSLSSLDIARVKRYKAQLHALSKLPCGNDADFKGMLLFWIRPVAKEGGSADVLPAGRVALLLLTMHDFPVRQVYLHCQPQGSLEKGALVDISLDLESFSDIVQMSMWMVGLGHSFEVWTLTFEYASLQQLRVLSLADATEAVDRKISESQIDPELMFIKKIAKTGPGQNPTTQRRRHGLYYTKLYDTILDSILYYDIRLDWTRLD